MPDLEPVNSRKRPNRITKMSTQYSINLDSKFNLLELIDVNKLVAACKDSWYNQTLCKINDSVLRLGVMEKGEFHWHKHDNEDELFYCLEGQFVVEVEGGPRVELNPNQGFAVPKGVTHRTSVPHRAVVLMIEGADVSPVGD
jgi:mannose-6-phosphate isomerase-like protein (cupin superfamily)